MTLIKIDRASIKRNPRAGETVSMMQGHREAKFEFLQGGKIPADLLDKVEIMEWQGAATPKDGIHLRGYITDPDNWELFAKIPGISIRVDRGLQRIEHAPEPEYLYEHENPEIKCGHCGKMIPAHEIENDVIDDGAGGEIFINQVCPRCNNYDTFGEIEWERIGDALKEVNLQSRV